MKKRSLLAFVLLVFAFLSLPVLNNAQPENGRGDENPAGSLPLFFFDAYNYRSGDDAQTRVDMYVEVPYEGIQFVKTGNVFSAGYSVTLSIYNENKSKLINEKTFNESVVSKEFEATKSRHNHFLSVRSFELAPGNYVVRSEVEDKDSRKNYVREDKLAVKSFSAPVALSDILLVSKGITVAGKNQLIPNISNNVALQKEGLNLFFEAYADKEMPARIEYAIKDNKGKTIYSKSDTGNLKVGANQVSVNLQNPQISMGDYELTVSLKSPEGTQLAQSTKKFFSKWAGLPNTVSDLDKAVDQMVYIAKDNELDEIKDSKNREEKLDRYLKFWKEKDPSPSTEQNEVFEEYYRRIAYANGHFKHYQEGWRTDMGMIYVTLGPPSNVERHPFEYDSKPYEVWDYYDINKRFVFVDQTGFGDYRLLDPVYGNWWRYRQ